MKILYITTISDTMGFFPDHIKMLLGQGHTVDLACNIVNPVKQEIINMGCKIHQIPFQRFPLRKDNLIAYKMLKEIIIDEGYDLVHTHTPIASAITRLACKNIKKIKVLYTAHGFHFYKGAPIKNWIIYYPIEKWLSKYTDTLITINKEDYERAKNDFKAKRVEYIPGVGLDIDKFTNVVVDKAGKRQELGLPEDAFVILSVGELNKNKNHEVVIRAIAKLNNPNIHYVICGKGSLESYLKKLSTELGIGENLHLLGYREDIPEICKISDVFAFPSFREGLPVSVMEAMASGLPVICSQIRGNTDLIDTMGGGLFNPHSIDSCKKSILEISKNNWIKMSKYNIEKIKIFSDDAIKKKISMLYKEV